MSAPIQISATIVLYNEPINELQKTIHSFLKIPQTKQLFLVDNSPINKLEQYCNQSEITYLFNNKNVGFGKAHNQVIPKLTSQYHLILNPDVVFKPKVISELINVLQKNKLLAMISPEAEFPNGKPQYIARKYPAFFDLIIRRLGIFQNRIKQQEYHDKDLSKPFYPDFIHGCFMLFKTADFIALNGFDERYFLYMEDVDICKKIDLIGKKKMYYPNVSITHTKREGSSKSIRLLRYHLISMLKYFLKWRGK